MADETKVNAILALLSPGMQELYKRTNRPMVIPTVVETAPTVAATIEVPTKVIETKAVSIPVLAVTPRTDPAPVKRDTRPKVVKVLKKLVVSEEDQQVLFNRAVESGKQEDLMNPGIAVDPKIYDTLKSLDFIKRTQKFIQNPSFLLRRGILDSPDGPVRLGEIMVLHDPYVFGKIYEGAPRSVVAVYVSSDFDCNTELEFRKKHHEIHPFWTGELNRQPTNVIIYTLSVEYKDGKSLIRWRYRLGHGNDKDELYPFRFLQPFMRRFPYTTEQRKLLEDWTGNFFRGEKDEPTRLYGKTTRELFKINNSWLDRV